MIALPHLSQCIRLLSFVFTIFFFAWAGLPPAQANNQISLAEMTPRAYVPILIANPRATATPTRTPAPTATPNSPNNALRGIYGIVTEGSKPVSLVNVELMVTSDEVTWTSIGKSSTDLRGHYNFSNAPTLPSGQKYAVHYVNFGNSKHLDLWVTHRLIAYTAGANINMGSFDLTNIELELPIANATVALPSAFKWKLRTNQPGEKYQFSVITFPEGDSTDFISPKMDSGAYILNKETLPTHYVPFLTYGWEIWVNEPDNLHTAVYEEGNGYGISYEKRPVIFSTVLQ